MAQFADITITRTGLDMIAKSQTGDKLIFTGIKIGDGQIGAQSIPDMTDLINFKQDVPINSVIAKENGHAEIIGIIDNENLDVGFFVREIGIFAKINDGGTPALYGYANAGNLASYMSDKSVPMDAIKFKIDIVIGNSENVSFTSDKSIVYVTQENLDAHNESEDSHPDIRQKITTDIADHNTSNTAHQDIRQKITDLGNPVVNVEEKGGVVNVTKSNGDKNQFYSGLNILQRNKEYAVGDIAYSPHLKSYQYLECITAGTTGDTDPDFSTVVTGWVINDGTLRFILRTIKDTAMTGDITFRPYVAPGWVKAVGDTVNRADYPTLTKFADDYDLWTDTPAEEPWKFGNGDGSTTMMLPDYRERIIQGGDTVEAREAGLPDIQGSIIAARSGATGAFTNETPNINSALGYDTNYRDMNTNDFKASRYNSIYGASTTVQPPAIVLIPQIKI